MKRRIALVAAALVLALIGVTAVRSYVGKADARAVAGLDPVQAYVAQKPIPSGTALKDAVAQGLATVETWPRRTVPLGAIAQVTPSLDNLVATGPIPAGTLLLRAAFGVKQQHQDGLPIPRGQIAVTISLNDPQRVGGFVQPGSQIAVFDTYNTLSEIGADGHPASGNHDTAAGDGLTMGETKEHVTRLLLARVDVIAIGSSVAGAPAAPPADGSSADAKSSGGNAVLVTVALAQRDAEKLILASQTGTLYLGLVNQASHVTPGAGANNTSLFK